MHRSGPQTPIRILLVEDSPDDADLMLAALEEGTLSVQVVVVEDGEEAMQYLARQGAWAGVPRPDLILMDLFLPRKNGDEVLAEIKQDPELRRIPVIMLTGQASNGVVNNAYDLHANCFISKPADQEEFAAVVRRIEQFWCTVARLPRSP